MTIQRQYSLPNCTLSLEGLGDPMAPADLVRPLMTILVNAECYLMGQTRSLSGGREFFESLLTAVSQYAQEVLSGIPHRDGLDRSGAIVQLHRINPDCHRLSMRPQSGSADAGIEVDLNTVQLFDLVEAIDQFFADTQTLPDLSLRLQPLSRRFVRSTEPIVQRATPAAIGISSVALVAIACFWVPVPSVKEPTDPLSRTQTSSTNGNSQPSPTTPPVAGSSPSPTTSPTPSPTTSPQAQADLAKLETVLTKAPSITDTAQVEGLRTQLYDRINQAWKNRTPFVQDLIYHVGVDKNGAIIGYKPVNPAALTYANQTPLLNLLYVPTEGIRPESEPIAQYKVVFTGSGVLEVAPWQQAMATPLTGVPEITDSEALLELQQKLYDQLDQAWKTTPTFESDLTFRVRVKADGTIADYTPENQPAIDYAQEIPLPSLGKPFVDGTATTETNESLALFKVVFKPDGKLEVSPWRGRPDE